MDTRSITFTKPPEFLFETHEGFQHNISFSTENPDVIKDIAKEIIYMLHFHYGKKEMTEFLKEQINHQQTNIKL